MAITVKDALEEQMII